MGSVVSYIPESGYNLYFHPEVTPSPFEEPTFPPDLGFSGPRKERVMIATDEEMRSAKIPLHARDYCAHVLLDYQACRRKNWPWPVLCHHEKHAYLTCEYEDFVLRLKEYERERRLRVRELKKSQSD